MCQKRLVYVIICDASRIKLFLILLLLQHVSNLVVESSEVTIVVCHGAAHSGHVLRGHKVEDGVMANDGVLCLP